MKAFQPVHVPSPCESTNLQSLRWYFEIRPNQPSERPVETFIQERVQRRVGIGRPSGFKGGDDVSEATLSERSQIQPMLYWNSSSQNRISVVNGEKTHGRRRCLSNIPNPIFAHDKVEESSVSEPLTGSKQGSEQHGLKREPNQVRDGIGNKWDPSNWQMSQLNHPLWVELNGHRSGRAAVELRRAYTEWSS